MIHERPNKPMAADPQGPFHHESSAEHAGLWANTGRLFLGRCPQCADRDPGGGVNMALEAVDRHAAGPLANQDALRFVQGTGEVLSVSYGELAASSNRFANVLQSLGVAKGDRVFSLIGRTPELYTAVAGTLKNGSVFCPLFFAFGPEPVKQRLLWAKGRYLSPPGRSIARRSCRSGTPSPN